MARNTQKIYAGTQLRDLRARERLTQREFAGRLGVSVSYLNQMENNNRPLAAALILNLAREFELNLSELAAGDATRLVADMREVFADPLFTGEPQIADLNLVASNAPIFAKSFLELFRAYRHQSERMASFEAALGTSAGNPHPQPWEEVRDFFHYTDNYLDALDRSAEMFAAKFVADEAPNSALERWLQNRGIALAHHIGAPLRQFDRQARVLSVSSSVNAPTQLFQIAVFVAYEGFEDLLDSTVDMAQFHSEEANAICKIGLANYFAGAVLMPYQRFLQAAYELRHDLEALSQRFKTSIEQNAHRLSTLQRPGNRGVPFFFVRVDQAGTITKRHSSTRLQFARFGGACPHWNVHRAFETPGQYLRQLAETPEGVRYFCLARDVSKSGGSFRAPIRRYAIGLGCEIDHVKHIVYADDLSPSNPAAFEPIGTACRICPRSKCHQRSVPPLDLALKVNHDQRDVIPYLVQGD